jgi:Peptidase family M23
MNKIIAGLLVFASLSLKISAQTSFEKQTQSYLDIPINVEVMNRPMPVKATDGKWHLSYTLLITNFSFSDLTLLSASVSDKQRNRILTTYGTKELNEYYRYRTLVPTPPRSTMPDKKFPNELSSGRTAVLFFWLEIDSLNDIPQQLSHTLIFKNNELIKILKDSIYDMDSNIVFRNYVLDIDKQKPVVIAPPVKGDNWYCANAPAYNTDHQYLTIRNGKMRIAQRFAIDFKKVDKDSNTLPSPFPDTISNKMFYGYGEKVYAVADGIIVDIKDSIPENIPQANGDFIPAVPMRHETVSGNKITLKIKEGCYAFYAHLQPRSIRVKVGDRVKKGQLLGLLGNSGNAGGPHLHFHIGNSNSLNGSEGIPFVFESFILNKKIHINEIPIDGDIINFKN